MRQVKDLKDKNGDKFYPKAHAKATFLSDGKDAEQAIADAIEKGRQLALRALFVAAGAEYNDTASHIVKDTPWKAYVDSVDYKAQWDLDVVAGSVQTLTYGGKSYEYVDDNGTWKIIARVGDKLIWDDTKVIHRKGYYHLNGLGDITEEQMTYTYANSHVIYNINLPRLKENDKKIRTFIPTFNSHSVSTLGKTSYSTFAGCSNLEVLMWSIVEFTSLSNIVVERLDVSGSYLFNGCSKLRYVHPMKCTTSGNIPNMFGGCISLIEAKIYEVKGNISFSDSSMINKDSILCLIQNAVPTTAIAITLHPDAYARLADDADIVAALAAQPLVTLVSA